MQDIKMLEKLEKQSRMPNISTKRTISDLPRLEARDIPDDGTLPNGERVVFGKYEHTIRAQGGRKQTMTRWMPLCPLCQCPARVLYDLDGHFMCQRCTHLPFRSAVSGRSERAAMKLAKVAPDDPSVSSIHLRLQRDCLHDADMSNARYHEKMRKKRADRAATPPVARYELPDVDSFGDGS